MEIAQRQLSAELTQAARQRRWHRTARAGFLWMWALATCLAQVLACWRRLVEANGTLAREMQFEALKLSCDALQAEAAGATLAQQRGRRALDVTTMHWRKVEGMMLQSTVLHIWQDRVAEQKNVEREEAVRSAQTALEICKRGCKHRMMLQRKHINALDEAFLFCSISVDRCWHHLLFSHWRTCLDVTRRQQQSFHLQTAAQTLDNLQKKESRGKAIRDQLISSLGNALIRNKESDAISSKQLIMRQWSCFVADKRRAVQQQEIQVQHSRLHVRHLHALEETLRAWTMSNDICLQVLFVRHWRNVALDQKFSSLQAEFATAEVELKSSGYERLSAEMLHRERLKKFQKALLAFADTEVFTRMQFALRAWMSTVHHEAELHMRQQHDQDHLKRYICALDKVLLVWNADGQNLW
jgi:hypothetical protein